jgi:hypothetical protein
MMNNKIYRGIMCSIIFSLFLSAAACKLADSSTKTITIRIINTRSVAVRFLAGGSNFLTWEPEFNRYWIPLDIAAADVNVEIPSGEEKSFTLQPESGGTTTRDWFVQEENNLDEWAPGASENNPDVNDYQFKTGHTYTMTIKDIVVVPDALHFTIE